MSATSDEEINFNEQQSGEQSVAHAEDTDSRSSNVPLIAGVVLAGVGIAAAIGIKFIFNKKPTVAPSRPSKARQAGRRKVPPRRPRSVASESSSRQQR